MSSKSEKRISLPIQLVSEWRIVNETKAASAIDGAETSAEDLNTLVSLEEARPFVMSAFLHDRRRAQTSCDPAAIRKNTDQQDHFILVSFSLGVDAIFISTALPAVGPK